MKLPWPGLGMLATPSPPARGAWVEITKGWAAEKTRQSPPARGAWVEMMNSTPNQTGTCVAPCAGGVG